MKVTELFHFTSVTDVVTTELLPTLLPSSLKISYSAGGLAFASHVMVKVWFKMTELSPVLIIRVAFTGR